MKTRLALFALALSRSAAAACRDSQGPAVVATVVVNPTSPTLTRIGGTLQLAAEARDARGTALTGHTFTWTTSDSSTVRVSDSGLVTAVAPGTATITATTGGVAGSASVTVAPAVASVVVTPAAPSLSSIGATRQLTAEARDSGNTVLAGLTFTWSSGDTTKVRVSASGLVTAMAAGSATITATTAGALGSVSVTVAPVVASVVVVPAAPTLFAIGATRQLAAEARDSGNTAIAGLTFVWTTSDSTKVRVSASGLVTAVAPGSATITATTAGIAAGTSVTVTPVVASIAVTPASPALTRIGDTLQLTAEARDSGGTVLAGQSFVWRSSDTTTVRVSPGGLVTGVGWGAATVTAAAGAVTGGTMVAVTQVVPALSRISAGESHVCALTTAGTAYCWGRGDKYQVGDGQWYPESRSSPVGVLGGLSFQAISAGLEHTCGLTTAGTAYCWGDTDHGQLGDGTTDSHWGPVAVAGGLTFHAIAAGNDHTCALTSGGTAYCWGADSNGQLGDGATGTERWSPVAVGGGLTFQAVSAGGDHTCALTPSGTAYCWGDNSRGQLGDGTTTARATPVAVGGGLVFAAISVGGNHACALTPDGVAYCWGGNRSGELGDGTTDARSTPVPVAGGLTFHLISAGSGHTCALTTGRVAYCCGGNGTGQLGDGTTDDRANPVGVGGGLSFQGIDAGYGFTCGLATGGVAFCWGVDSDGQLGDGSTGRRRPSPAAVRGGLTFQAISVGYNHACALTTGGAAFCWGENNYGQLGIGPHAYYHDFRFAPVAVGGGLTFQAISAGYTHTCALTTEGAAYCWGTNDHGQLGTDTRVPSDGPVAVVHNHRFQDISAGFESTCGLATAGAVYCWGAYPVGDGTRIERATPQLVGSGLTFQALSRRAAVTTGGAACWWGSSPWLGISPVALGGGFTFRTISVWEGYAGYYPAHGCGLSAAGVAYCWGDNRWGQLGDSTFISSPTPVAVAGGLTFQAVSAGVSSTCALTAVGAAYCWGSDAGGLLGVMPIVRTSPVAVEGAIVFGAPAALPPAAVRRQGDIP